MLVKFLYSYEMPRDLLGLPFDHDNPAHIVVYAYHPNDEAGAAPSFSYMLVL
jgi:hypothetical protein